MNVLTPLQRDFLFRFFAQPASAPFALTGGTALAAFHLQHRISDDIDLFAVAPMGDDELQYSEVLEEFYLGMALKAVDKIGPDDLPMMLKPIDLDEMKASFTALAAGVARRAKPE
jgi:hypothetical protein